MAAVSARGRGRLAVGIVLTILGVFATVAGVAVVVLVGPDGSIGLPPTRFLGTGVALTLPQLDVPRLPARQKLTLDAGAAPTGAPLFLGIASSADVDAYLRGAPIDVIQQIDWPGAARTEPVTGSRTPGPPSDQNFWVVSAQGTEPSLHWVAAPGDWTLVVMRADAQPALDVTLSGGVTIGALGPTGIVVLLAAVALLALGVTITVRAAIARPS
jgi:hypothetical protein